MAGDSPNTEQDWDDMPYAPFVEGITGHIQLMEKYKHLYLLTEQKCQSII